MSMKMAREFVRAGVMLLDTTPGVPDNWRELVPMECVNMSNGNACILGHIFRDVYESSGKENNIYNGYDWAEQYVLRDYQLQWYGFTESKDPVFEDGEIVGVSSPAYYPELQAAWAEFFNGTLAAE